MCKMKKIKNGGHLMARPNKKMTKRKDTEGALLLALHEIL